MIIVSSSMVKSGSLWYYRLTDELLAASDMKDDLLAPKHSAVKDLHEGDKIKCPQLTFSNLSHLIQSSQQGYSYPVKTHAAPTLSLALFGSIIRTIKVTYIYRDPRDVVLSILDHAKKARENNLKINLRDIYSISDAIDFVSIELNKWKKWHIYSNFFNVHTVKYEDLVSNTHKEVTRLASFLNIDVCEQTIHTIIQKYDRGSSSNNQSEKIVNNIHYNKGYSGRYENEMDKNEIQYCTDKFLPYLKEMGYIVETTDTLL